MYVQNLRKAHAKGLEAAHGEEQLGMGIFIPNSATFGRPTKPAKCLNAGSALRRIPV